MRLIAYLFGFAILLIINAASFAQSTDASLYTVDYTKIISDSQVGIEIQRRKVIKDNELQNYGDEIAKERLTEERRLSELREQISLQEFTPLAEEFDTQTEEDRENFQNLKDSLQNEINTQVEQLRLVIDSEIDRVAKEIGGVIVIDSRFVIYASPERDLTDLIIDRLDMAFVNSPSAFEEAIFSADKNGIDLIFQYNNDTSVETEKLE